MRRDEKALFRQAEEHLRAMRVMEALAAFERAEREQCDADSCAAGRWTCHMLKGDFERAWKESDSIAQRGNPDPHRFWDGRALDGRRVILRCLHGLGDTIQFVRYAPLVREKARFLTIEVQPSLKALLAYSGLADAVITWGEREPEWDQQIEVMELPRIFRTELSTVPNEIPYLGAPSMQADYEKAEPDLLRVGIVWSSSSYNHERSIPVELIAQLCETPGASFFSLQAGPERFDLEQWTSQVPSLSPEDGCVLRTASILPIIHLVITVDTMVAHLAGALGRPVWTLLPHRCDWRWMLEREDTPWYPTMRLVRQAKPGDWARVIQRVRQDLIALAAR